MNNPPPPPWAQPGAPAPQAAPQAAPVAPWTPPALPGAPPGAPPWQGAPQAAPAPPWQGAPANPGYPSPAPAQAPWQGAQPAQNPGYPPPGYAPPGYPPPGYAPQGYGQPTQPLGAEAVLAGLAQTTVSEVKEPYFPANGNFLVELDQIKMFPSKDSKRLGHTMVVVLAKVLQTDAPGIVPGALHAQVIDLNKFGLADLKVWLAAAHGAISGNAEHEQALLARGVYAPATVIEIVRSQTAGGAPIRGRKMLLATPLNKKGSFTKHMWRPAPPGV